MVMAPTRSCEPCHFADNCWRPLCPYTHPGNGRCKKWAAVWCLLAEQENAHHSPPKILQIRRRDFCVKHWERILLSASRSLPSCVQHQPLSSSMRSLPSPRRRQLKQWNTWLQHLLFRMQHRLLSSSMRLSPPSHYTAPVPVNENVASAFGDEELVDLLEEDKVADPLRRATIKLVLDGVVYYGEVEEIEKGKLSHDRLYRVKYTDGDIEHFTADQVKEMRCPLQDVMLAQQAQATHDHLARNVRAPEDRRNAEHIVNALKRYTGTEPVSYESTRDCSTCCHLWKRAPVTRDFSTCCHLWKPSSSDRAYGARTCRHRHGAWHLFL